MVVIGTIAKKYINYKTDWYQKYKPEYNKFNDGIHDYWGMKYNDRIRNIKTKGKDLLDVGCGMGRAINFFSELGYKCTGVEPSDYACGIATQYCNDIHNCDFKDFKTDRKFDVIHIEQVLSHMEDVRGTLSKCYDLLNPGGCIIVEEPNDFNLLQEILQKKGYTQYWLTEDHINYFNFETLEDELTDLGFNIGYRTCTFPMELFELMGNKYLGNEDKGKECHRLRYELLKELGIENRTKLKETFASLGLGRDLVVYAYRR